MNTVTKRMTKINFKKTAKWYIVLLLLCAVASAVLLGVAFQDKLALLYRLERLNEQVERGKSVAEMEVNLQKLADSSSDVVDVLVLDRENKILFSAKDSAVGQGESLHLQRVPDTGKSAYFFDDTNADVLFKLQKEEEFFISKDIQARLGEIRRDYDDSHFFQADSSGKQVYGISYLSNRKTGEKVYLITDVQPVHNGILYLKIAAALAVLFFMVYWVLVALWVYADAAKTKQSAVVWGLAALLTNLAGVVVYLIYKNIHLACTRCGALQNRSNRYCVHCGAPVGDSCAKCGGHVGAKDLYCANCGVGRQGKKEMD